MAPVSPAESDEAGAFLRWLGENNFTLLGLRDYDFADGAEQPPLGVLRRKKARFAGRSARRRTR